VKIKVFILVVLAAALTGCGGASKNPNDPADPDPPTEDEIAECIESGGTNCEGTTASDDGDPDQDDGEDESIGDGGTSTSPGVDRPSIPGDGKDDVEAPAYGNEDCRLGNGDPCFLDDPDHVPPEPSTGHT
jgi:hypothetical protein